ncbi:MAG: SusC/RagA family TonB-linked outer membrane protein [Bacteroidetes bacterium]|nr:SusC/RagA family TonB-linked outer membrane protein [Bacteroidota bacterium]
MSYIKRNSNYLWRIKKILLVMKLTLIAFFLCTLQVSASLYSQTKHFDLLMKDVSVKEVLKTIESQSDFRFFYNDELSDLNRLVSLDIRKNNVEDILIDLFDHTDVSYKVLDNNLIVITPTTLIAQQLKVSGTITDGTNNEPLIGVNITIEGTTEGTVTDINGNYSIEVPSKDAVLVFSYIGFMSEKIVVGEQTIINVVLIPDITDLEEVIVIGYGVEKKKLSTGATIQVKGENITKQSTVSAITALQSLTPGVSIIKENGEPGAGFKVYIRGAGTIGNSQPLYVVDGVPGGNIDYLNPSDIETIDILKDAASAAIYGSRAANGVVLVTTKRGESASSKANISYDGYYGWQNLYKKLPMANAKEYAALLSEARVNSGQPPLDFATLVPNWDLIENGEWEGTDWLDNLTVKNASTQNHSVNIFGNTEVSNYSVGFSYTNQDGIIGDPVASHYERYSIRLNSDYRVIRHSSNTFDILKVGESLRYSFTDRGGIGTGNQYWNDIFSATVASPFLPMYADDTDDPAYPYYYSIPWNMQEANPIASMVYNRGMNKNKNHNLNGNLYVELQPINNLKFRSSFGYSMSGSSYRRYVPVYDLSATSFNLENDVTQNMNVGMNWTFENTLSYNFNINDVHAFTLLAGTSAERWGLGEYMGGTNKNSLFDDLEHAYLDNTRVIYADGTTTMGGNPWGIGGIYSYFGRASYNYKEKYMATAIIRADASSNFAPDKRMGYFPSVSAGWVLTEENFLKDKIGILNFLKLRASWGQNGNQAIDPFQYLATISFENVNYFFGGDKSVVYTGGYPNILPNPDVTWETSDQLNIGFDSRLFGGRMNLAFDWYNKKTDDWLVRADALAIFGTGAPYINGGDVSNKGIELALGWNDRIGDFTYNVGVNLSHNKNEITSIANTEGIIYGPGNVLGQGTEELYRAQVGYPIGYFRGYETAGVFQNEAEVLNYQNSEGIVIMPGAVPGDLIFVDSNNDGVISNDDKVMIGDPNPDYTAGLNFTLGYKGFDFTMAGYGMFGHQIARSWRRWADSPQNNYTTDIFDRWHGEGSSNTLPRLTYGSHINWQYVSDIFIEDADFFRISNVTLGYDFKKLFEDMPLTQARIYVTAQNLFTFTKYSGMDPEIGTSSTNDNWAKGVDIGFYPSPRTVIVGVNLKF